MPPSTPLTAARSAWPSPPKGDDVVFRVRDNGIGIPPEMLARIFDLFAQVDHSLDHSQGGLGLGLTLVRSLVEMHGGSVEARSDGLGRGSEFIVRLPILDLVPVRAKATGAGARANACASEPSQHLRSRSGR